MRIGQVVGGTSTAFHSGRSAMGADRIPRWASEVLEAPDLPELEGSVIEVIEVAEVEPRRVERRVASGRSRGSVHDVTLDASSARPTFEPTADSIRRPKQMWD